MYSYECSACNQKFITDIVNRSKCLICGSTQVHKTGKENSSTGQEQSKVNSSQPSQLTR